MGNERETAACFMTALFFTAREMYSSFSDAPRNQISARILCRRARFDHFTDLTIFTITTTHTDAPRDNKTWSTFYISVVGFVLCGHDTMQCFCSFIKRNRTGFVLFFREIRNNSESDFNSVFLFNLHKRFNWSEPDGC